MTHRSRTVRLFGRTSRTLRKAPARFRLRVEELEDRVTPTTFHVANLFDDTGAGTLRSAIIAANNNPGPDTIDFIDPETDGPLSGTIILGGAPLPPINEDLTIVSQDEFHPLGDITISGNNLSRVLEINPGVTVNLSALTIVKGAATVGSSAIDLDGGGILNLGPLNISHCTISGTQAGGSGGGIYNTGTLNVDVSTLSDNSAAGGGGIGNQGTLTVTNSSLLGNSATNVGGGIFNDQHSTLTVGATTLSGNSATNSGGGIFNYGNATLTVTNSTLSENSTDIHGFTFGGGIFNLGMLTVTDSSLSENSAGAGGGGIENSEEMSRQIVATGTAIVTNSTLSGNSADLGGGINNDGADCTLTVTNSTLSGNSATTTGGGIQNLGTVTVADSTIAENTAFGIHNAGTVTLTNTIVAGDFDGLGGDPVELASAYNLIDAGANDGGLVNGNNGNLVGVDPLLGPLLAGGGGPTPTRALLPGSPAINFGSNALVPIGVTTDQRGFARIRAGTVDIGAFEVQPDPPTLTVDHSAVIGYEHSGFDNFGDIDDPQGSSTVTLTASLGQVLDEGSDLKGGDEWEIGSTPRPTRPTARST